MNKEDIIKKIRKKILKFDFDDFFFNDSDENYCAIKIITPIQDICFYTEYHDAGAELIMRGLYDNFDENFSGNPYWPDLVNEMGCIAIQILKRNFIIVNIPKKINKFQFEKLFSFYQDMIRINGILRKAGEEIDIQTNVVSGGSFLNLGKALMHYKNSLYDFKNDDENIIEYEKNIRI